VEKMNCSFTSDQVAFCGKRQKKKKKIGMHFILGAVHEEMACRGANRRAEISRKCLLVKIMENTLSDYLGEGREGKKRGVFLRWLRKGDTTALGVCLCFGEVTVDGRRRRRTLLGGVLAGDMKKICEWKKTKLGKTENAEATS